MAVCFDARGGVCSLKYDNSSFVPEPRMGGVGRSKTFSNLARLWLGFV